MTVPTIEFAEFDVSQVNPSGQRNSDDATAFVKVLGSTSATALSFGSINIDSKSESATKVLLARISNLGGNTRIQNMRFWAPSVPTPIGSLGFNMEISPLWIQNNSLTEASGTLPTTLPATQNLFRGHSANSGSAPIIRYNENWPHMSGVIDPETSEWIYLNITVDTDVTTGRYGIGGRSALTYRMTFDYL